MLIAVGLLGLALTGIAGADNEAGNLPGGSSIEVAIVNPAHGSVQLPGAIAVDGTAAVGEAQAVASTRLVYVLDVSGSTADSAGVDCDGVAGNDSVLECEVVAAKALNEDAISLGTIADVGVVAFASSAATGDVGPAGGDQLLTGPSTDADAAGGIDVEQVLGSAFSTSTGPNGLAVFTGRNVGVQTNFEAAVQQADALATAGSPPPSALVVFLSDGFATAGGNAVDDANAAPGFVDYATFAVGNGSDCDNAGGGRGSLRQIAEATGGTCTQVTNIAQLPEVVPGVIASELSRLDIQVDGGAFNQIANSDITPDLPQPGPVGVDYATSVDIAAAGLHEICVKATGSDGGGIGDITDCHTIRIDNPPDCSQLQASPQLLWPPNHKLRTVIISGASDPDGDDLTQTITGVTQDEPVNGLGDGNTSPDAQIVSASQVRLRAERSGLGDGRVYRVAVHVEDEFGLSCDGIARVGVPHDQGQGSVPIDSAPPSFDSLLP